ncbi:hypothetical protein MMC30_007765 [Trapelia coarctata]|nr:hypothetical protein [Trapelia coarctata]
MTSYSTAPSKASLHPRRAGEWDFVSRSDATSPVSSSESESGFTPASEANPTRTDKVRAPAEDFFASVAADCYPQSRGTGKVQPWRKVWEGPQQSSDGKLLVACPKRCDFGTYPRDLSDLEDLRLTVRRQQRPWWILEK